KSSKINIKDRKSDEFSYQPMMFLDFIDEEEKEQLNKESEKPKEIPRPNVSIPPAKPVNKYNINKKTVNKFDNVKVAKSTMKHGKIPDNRPNQQIHSLGFVDDI